MDEKHDEAMRIESAAHDEFQFQKRAERKLRHKIDLYIVPLVALLYLFCFIDRANIGNARIAGLEADLDLHGYDYNLVLSAFYISYAICEIPATMLCKKIGPGWFLPISTIFFGICTIATGFVHTRAQIIAVRVLLGIFEAGLLPGIAYYLSRWYRRSELTLRLGYYMVMTPLAGAFGGLFASGILSIDRIGSVTRWRMIFVVEGIITAGLGFIALAFLTDNPNTARWLSEEEKQLAIDRVKIERVGQDVVLDKFSSTRMKRGFLNPATLSTAVVFLLNNVVALGIAFFLPTIIRTIYPGKTVVQLQLLSVPPYVVAAACLLSASYASSKMDNRQLFLCLHGPLVLVGYAMLLSLFTPGARYAAIFLTASSIYIGGPFSNAQVSANTVSDTSRNIGISVNSGAGYLGGLIATWTYLPFDGPRYPIGNGINLAATSVIIIVTCSFYAWMIYDNKKRNAVPYEEKERRLANLTHEEVANLEYKHPDFRWQP